MPAENGNNWKLTLAYDGSDFHGWQIQPAHTTIQGELAAAVERVTGERILPQGSGRTDTGVHARRQVASCHLRAPIPPENLQRALNRTLPATIRILAAEHAPGDFHARHSVVAKTYEYRIWLGTEHGEGLCPPWLTRYVHAVTWHLDLGRMQQAAKEVLGEHDFTSFAASDPDLAARQAENPDPDAKRGNIRTIFSSEFLPPTAADPRLLLYRVRGNGFLHHMVRNLVGTFIDAGRGQIASDYVKHILDRRARSAAGPTAPASGLFLDSVEY
ncbi:tRNA pseudouridine(38-40) synthase TruA [Silvibacterium acidisoli]|uniref:tRNA pseudouridine(38-40) synthase TruA n=1 Tax=Acidobacteriaceae bacterium ZG23-2 TaxID=2883246 RepID=UPI00406BF38D